MRFKYFKGSYRELTIFVGKLQLRLSTPQIAAWWDYREIFSIGNGHQ